MKYVLPAIVLLFGSALASAGSGLMGGAFAKVTYTRPNGEVWIDSGIIVRDFQEPSPVRREYSLRTIEFTDHANGYHLDEGTVEVLYR